MTSLAGNVHEFDQLRAHALGWRGLLDGLRVALERLATSQEGAIVPITISIAQVKEKYGGLRCYVDFYHVNGDVVVDDLPFTNLVLELLEAAEQVSELLCYLCGAGATRRGSGYWIRYFCAEHDTVDLQRALAPPVAKALQPYVSDFGDDKSR